MSDEPNPIDPGNARDVTELAALLRQLRAQAGSPPVAEIVRRWPGLSKASVYRVLNGEQLPSALFLPDFLRAHGVEDKDHGPWVLAQNRLNRRRPGAALDSAALDESEHDRGDTEPQIDTAPQIVVHPALAPRSSSARRRGLIGAAVAVVLVVVGLTAYILLRPSTEIPRCDPPGCTVAGRSVTLSGHLPPLPAGHEAYILTRVDPVNRWYLGPAILPDGAGNWSSVVNIGSADKQGNDRRFTICSYVLASSALPELTNRLVAQAPNGVSVDQLPTDRAELVCVKAVRLKET